MLRFDHFNFNVFDLERSLFNANRPEEWEKARTLLKEE